jgi:hypothetical protein
MAANLLTLQQLHITASAVTETYLRNKWQVLNKQIYKVIRKFDGN